MYKDNNKQKF